MTETETSACLCCSVLTLLQEGTTEEISASLPWICREPNSCWICILQDPRGCGVCLMTKSEMTSGMARAGLSYHTVSCTPSHSQHGSASPGLLVLSAWRCAGGIEGQHGMSCCWFFHWHFTFVSCDLRTWYLTVFSLLRKISSSLFSLPITLQKTTCEAMVSWSSRWYVSWMMSSMTIKTRSSISSSAGFSGFLWKYSLIC